MTTYQYTTPDHVTQNVNGVGPWTARKHGVISTASSVGIIRAGVNLSL